MILYNAKFSELICIMQQTQRLLVVLLSPAIVSSNPSQSPNTLNDPPLFSRLYMLLHSWSQLVVSDNYLFPCFRAVFGREVVCKVENRVCVKRLLPSLPFRPGIVSVNQVCQEVNLVDFLVEFIVDVDNIEQQNYIINVFITITNPKTAPNIFVE